MSAEVAQPAPRLTPSFDDERVQRAVEQEREEWLARVQSGAALTPQNIPDYRATPNPFQSYPPETAGQPAAQTPAEDFPFNVHIVSLSAGTLTVRVTPGTFSGVMPKIGATALDAVPAPTLSHSAAGTIRVWLKVNSTPTAAHNFVVSASVSTVVAEIGTAVPADDHTTAHFYVALATFVDGVKTAQDVETSLSCYIEDDGSAASSANLYPWRA